MNRNRALLFAGLGCVVVLLIAALLPLSLAGLAARGISRDRPAPTPVAASSGQIPQTGGSAAPDRLNVLFDQVNPGVVNIQVQVNQAGQTGIGAGSGFIYSDDGYIITNHHVVAGAEVVFISFFDGFQEEADVVGSDPGSDLAVLKIASLPPETHTLPLANSDDVDVGDEVVAIGNPFSLGSSMSYGIVSAVGRVIPSGFTQFGIPQAIQTDAAINPGNSGGPLINMSGEVIGVNAQIQTASGTNSGVGFAIPSNILSLVAPELIDRGTYVWPWLGVSGVDANQLIAQANNLESQQGAYIHVVVAGSPAADAGLVGSTGEADVNGLAVPTGGDVVIEADGEPIDNFDELLNRVAFKKPGDQIVLVVLRNGERQEVTVTLEPRPEGVSP